MYLIIDFETTGLDPDHHEPCQFAALLADEKLDHLASVSSMIKIEYPDRVSAEALKIQNRTISQISGAPRADFAVSLLTGLVSLHTGPLILVGHNIQFDFEFLNRFQRRHGFEIPLSPNLLDSNLLARFTVGARGLVPDTRLVTLAKYFEISFNAHDALGDVLATAAVLKRIKKDYPLFLGLAIQGKLYEHILDLAYRSDPRSTFVHTCKSQLSSRGFLSTKQISILQEMARQI